MNVNILVIEQQEQLQQAFEIRKAVFVEEQKVPAEEEIDGFDTLDSACKHILLVSESGEAIGTGRVRLVEGYGKIQRVAIQKKYRQYGFGRRIILELEKVAAHLGATKTKLDAQVHAIGFYEKLGYEVKSDVFMDAGIEHVLMTKSL